MTRHHSRRPAAPECETGGDAERNASTVLLYAGEAPVTATGARLDAVLAESLSGTGVSRARVQEYIRQGLALVDGAAVKKPNAKVYGGERLELHGRAAVSRLAPARRGVRVLYSDHALAVVDKPAGLTTHPAPGISEETLVHRLRSEERRVGKEW